MDPLDPATEHKALPALISNLAELGAERIILYGSRARGDAAERSDIDLAIDAPDISERKWFAIEDAVEKTDTLLKIDCILLQKAPDKLKENITRDGKVLYERTT